MIQHGVLATASPSEKKMQALHNRYIQYNRKVVSMQGPQTDELVEAGKIITPYPRTICTARFPLNPRDEKVLAVLLYKVEDIDAMGLSRPSLEDAVRFASQLTKKDVNIDRTVVFPSDPPFSGDVLPPSPWWPTLVWRKEKGLSEFCLWSSTQREEKWPENSCFVGIAKV